MSNAGKKLTKRPELRGLRGNAWARAWRRLRAAELRAAGLTCRGKPRRLRRWPELHGKSRREQNRFHEQQRRQRFHESGLTARRTPPKYRLLKYRPTELRWKAFRDTIVIPTVEEWKDRFNGIRKMNKEAA